MLIPDKQRKRMNNTYVLDAEDPAEVARLLDQDRILTESMGGLFSEQSDLAEVVEVLDIGCGPGGWVHEVARSYPAMEVTGVDISRTMIDYARAHARVRKIPNAHFQVMNALEFPLAFPAASFDLVNIRMLTGVVPPRLWNSLLAECRRLLRPEGVVRLSEAEWGFTNMPGLETFCALMNQAIQLELHSFSPTGRHLGVTPMMKLFLRRAGFQHIGQKAHVLDYSAGSQAHGGVADDYKLLMQLSRPLFLRTRVASQEELDALYEQVMDELQEEDCCALSFILTVWGRAPL
ncbi:methyltransferase domain-containing protein [Ktedonosporobacter rubrisoli]|uniref:Methyltransferase domain-containing protein n=1 Tax=Ktedonosporobacter rubrisoli TaxID=2509675 RepID=A0A4P6JWR5_KTERU|nr:methyltransferase domain-containing protein [Ktedonosporobacter rubrisoli]QBD79915.1 methyltransferase domain-containing protein [Ktedonosporobacter rubrisoli]